MTAGKARRRNRSQPVRPKLVAAASRSWGIVVRDSYTPNAMFLKMRKTTANSMPIGFPWNVATKNSRAAGKKTRMGIDWRTSRSGSMTIAAFLFVAAVCPKTIAKTRERRYATTIRAVEKAPRRGSWIASSADDGFRRAAAAPARITAPAKSRSHRRAPRIAARKGWGVYTGCRARSDTGQEPGENRFLRVQAVLGLVEHDRLRPIHDVVRDLESTVGR